MKREYTVTLYSRNSGKSSQEANIFGKQIIENQFIKIGNVGWYLGATIIYSYKR